MIHVLSAIDSSAADALNADIAEFRRILALPPPEQKDAARAVVYGFSRDEDNPHIWIMVTSGNGPSSHFAINTSQAVITVQYHYSEWGGSSELGVVLHKRRKVLAIAQLLGLKWR